MKAKGSQMERLIQAAGGAPADGSQVRSKYQTAGQMERLIEAMGGGGGSAPFVVTLTPTAADFSGTMDKTVGEIDAAYKAGKKIVFRFYKSGSTWYDIAVIFTDKESDDYPAYCGFGLLTERFVQVYSPSTMDGTLQTYQTAIYTLTPAT